MSKKRILFCGEASFLSTGFSTYYRELLPRLAVTGKYDIFEHGSYARQDHPEVNNFIKGRWKFYGNLPLTEEEAKAYNQPSADPKDKGQNISQFGAYKFDGVVADCKPDICIDIRDNWMLRWQLSSVFRPWIKLVWMPTVDSLPQHEDWIKDYEQADLIVAYADFGVHTLKQQSPLMRVFPKAMRPGVDLKTFYPMDRDQIREEFCIAKDVPIIGSLMRNQSRKLYPDLIDAFARMKNKYKGEKAVDKAILLLHSAWPDNVYSYDYPRHVMRLQAYPWLANYSKGIKDSVMQTLMCHNPACGKKSLAYAINLYNKPLRNGVILLPCMWCGQQTATCPTTGVGFSREELAKVYNLLDLYVQCSICFTPDTPVLTGEGWKNICDIREGEQVFGKDGQLHHVYKTMKNKTDSLVEVKLHGNAWSNKCTPNHPFLVVKDAWPDNKNSLREKIGQKNPERLDFEYKDAGDLQPDDMVVQTIPMKSTKPEIKLDDGTPIIFDEHFAWFLGVMVGDGNVNINDTTAYCRVTCASDDATAFQKINLIAKRLNHEAKIRQYIDRKAFDVNINDKRLAILLRKELYHDNGYKKSPFNFILWPPDLQLAFINGLIHADGHVIDEKVNGFTNTSPYVARDLYIALQKLGLYFNCHMQYPENKKPRYRFEINFSGKKSSTSSLYWKQDGVNYMLSKVKSITNIDYNDYVYNIDVADDHNYIICGHSVHNCEGDGMPVQEAKACGKPTLVMDYSAMREKGRFPKEYSHFKQLGITEDSYSCHKGGDVIDVGRYYYEPETSCMRALPDIDDLADKMRDLINNDEKRLDLGRDARKCVEDNYDWDKLAKQWEFVLDGIKIKDRSTTWETPIVVRNVPKCDPMPSELDNDKLLEWLYLNILKYPKVDPEGAKMWLTNMQSGMTQEQVYQYFCQTATQSVGGENHRQQIRAAVAKQKGEAYTIEGQEPGKEEWI